MKICCKRILYCLIILGLTLFLVTKLSKITEDKYSVEKYSSFFSQKEDFDVLFLGTSHVINGIFPMDLYDDYGIVSYNLGGHSNEIATTYWVLKNALDYTTPKLVVVDCMGLASNNKVCDNFSFLHHSLDAFPLSLNKIHAVFDLTNDEYSNNSSIDTTEHESHSKMELLFKYSTYHTRWNDLEEKDFSSLYAIERGAERRLDVFNNSNDIISADSPMSSDTVGKQYLDSILNLCGEKGIDVLLVYLPFPNNYTAVIEANYAAQYAQRNNINFINFLGTDLINYSTDFYNEDHLNPSGARKVTSYLGKYLKDNYNLPDRRNTFFSSWDNDLTEYHRIKIEYFKQTDSLLTYFMLLNDSIDFEINIGNIELLSDKSILAAFDNIGVDVTKINEETNSIIRKNNNIIYSSKICDKQNIEIIVYTEEAHIINFTYYLDKNDHVITTQVQRGNQ